MAPGRPARWSGADEGRARRVLRAAALFAALALATRAGAEPPAVPAIDALVASARGDPAAALAFLRDARPRLSAPATRATVDRLLATLSAPRRDAAAALEPARDLTRVYLRLYGEDWKAQLEGTAALFALAGDDAPALTESRTQTRHLAASFPREARAHGQLGFVIYQSGGDPLEAIASYKRCLELDPGMAQCEQQWRQVADDYQRPRCAGDAVRPLAAWQASKRRGDPRQRTVLLAGDLLFLEEPPLLTVGDVKDVTEGAGEVLVTLSAAGAARLPRLRPGGPGERWLVFLVGDELVMATPLVGALRGAHLRLSAVEVTLGNWCSRIERRTLPAALRPR